MATTQLVSALIGFDAAGNPTTLTVTAQLNITGASPQVSSVAYPLSAADKAGILAVWASAKAALGFP